MVKSGFANLINASFQAFELGICICVLISLSDITKNSEQIYSKNFYSGIDPCVEISTGEHESYGREPQSCLGQVFKFELGCFCDECNLMA